MIEITLISNEDDGDVIAVLDSQQLFMNGEGLLEGGSRGDGVHKQEPLSGPLF